MANTKQDQETRLRKVPTVTRLTSGSGTYVPPSNVAYIKVSMVGGGGGGQGSAQSAWGPLGASGSFSYFGTSLLSASGGGAGNIQGGGRGGYSVNSPAVDIRSHAGNAGGTGSNDNETASEMKSGFGGASAFGGAPSGRIGGSAGIAPVPNSGSGGGGGGLLSTTTGTYGAGGGAGGYVEAIIENPEASYSYTVGVGGGGGSAGTLGYVGASGAAGQIIIEEFYS